MYKRFLFIPAILFIFSVCMISCSDSDSTGPSNAELEQALRAQAAADLELAMASVSMGFTQFEGFEEPGAGDIFSKSADAFSPQDSVSYEYKDGWHIYYGDMDFSLDAEGLSIDISYVVIDSVQFKEDNVIIQDPDDNTDYLKFIMWVDAAVDYAAGDTTFVVNLDDYNINMEYNVEDDGDVIADGTLAYFYDIAAAQGLENGTGDIQYTMSINDLVLDDDTGCPLSGSLTATAIYDFDGTEGSLNGTWDLTVTVQDPNTIAVNFTSGDIEINFTEDIDCEEPASISLFEIVKNLAQRD